MPENGENFDQYFLEPKVLSSDVRNLKIFS